MKDQNRYGKYSKTRLPHDKETLPLRGEKDDTDRYFRCWNCGFVCDTQRDRLEPTNGTTGVIPTEFTDTDGASLFYPDVVKGCPFCGSTNYK